jgi:archaellum component FlaC
VKKNKNIFVLFYMTQHIRSISLGNYTREEIENIMTKAQKTSDTLMLYLDYIRNIRELPEDMLEKIELLDENSKMIIIKEYNRVIRFINILLQDNI